MKKFFISNNNKIKLALKKMSVGGYKTLIVVNKDKKLLCTI